MPTVEQEILEELKEINRKLDSQKESESIKLKEPAETKKVYKCDQCDFETENRHSFAAHARKHKGGE